MAMTRMKLGSSSKSPGQNMRTVRRSNRRKVRGRGSLSKMNKAKGGKSHPLLTLRKCPLRKVKLSTPRKSRIIKTNSSFRSQKNLKSPMISRYLHKIWK